MTKQSVKRFPTCPQLSLGVQVRFPPRSPKAQSSQVQPVPGTASGTAQAGEKGRRYGCLALDLPRPEEKRKTEQLGNVCARKINA